MKKWFFPIILLLFAQLSFCQFNKLNKGFIDEKTYYDEIPFEMVNGKIIVPVKIDNKNYRFIFDTGAANIVSKQVMAEINPTVIDKTIVTDASGRADSLKIISISRLQLGNILFRNNPSLVFDLRESEIFSCFDVDGFIGSNLLRNSVVQIDAEAKLLRITHHPKKLGLKKKEGIPIKLKGNISAPYFKIKMMGQENLLEEEIMFDTGMDNFFDLSIQTYEKIRDEKLLFHLASSQGASFMGLFGDAPEQNQHRVFVPKLQIGNFEIENLVTTTVVGKHSRIGAELLQYGLVTIDYDNKRFHFEPYKTKVDLSKKHLGFSPTLKDKKLVVGMVWDEELKNVIGYGDEIISINGKSFSPVKICDLLSERSIFKEVEFFKIEIRKTSGETILLELQKKFYNP